MGLNTVERYDNAKKVATTSDDWLHLWQLANGVARSDQNQDEISALAKKRLEQVTGLTGTALGPNASIDEMRLRSESLKDQQAYKQQGLDAKGKILSFADEFKGRAADRRGQLSTQLTDFGQKTFEQANPFILEDLNSRGLFTSASEVGNQQAQALKDIALENAAVMMGFDDRTFNTVEDLRGSAASAELGGDYAGLDTVLEMKRAGLSRTMELADADREERLASYLAKKQQRNATTSALIGAGGSILGGAIGSFGGPMGAMVGSQLGGQIGNRVQVGYRPPRGNTTESGYGIRY